MAVAERVAHAHLIGVEILRIYRPIVHTADGDATHARAVAQGGDWRAAPTPIRGMRLMRWRANAAETATPMRR